MTRFGTPGGNISRQFDVDRFFLDGCRDMVAMEIADEAVRPDADVASRLRCLEQFRSGVEKFHEAAPVRQRDVDGDPWRERTIRADIGLGVKNHDDGCTIVQMGIEVPPPFIVAPFRADALTVLKLRYFNGGDAKSLVIGGTISQPKVAILAAIHAYFSLKPLWIQRAWGASSRTGTPPLSASGFPSEPSVMRYRRWWR
jgi:hypothetical protein